VRHPTRRRQLKQTQDLLAAVLRLSVQPTRKFARVVEALHAGREAVVEIPWPPGRNYHQLTLHRVEGERVIFTNAARTAGLDAGMIVHDALPRKIEADGTESALLSDLQQLFEDGKGEALLL
jgi:hypothetical protein